MAITIVQSGQSAGGANSNSSTITAATAGNTVVAFCSQSGSTAAPTVTLGGNAMTVNATSAVYNSSADSVWVAYLVAAGGETSIAWTAHAGGTIRGNDYFELAGAAASVTLDGTPQHTDNNVSNTMGVAVTTSVAGSVILIGVGGNASSGTISAWTGTNVATNISTTASRCFGGSFITTVTVSSTFTANWTTSQVRGQLAIAFQPPAAGNVNLSPPTAVATGSAPTPGVSVSPAPATAVATGTANPPVPSVRPTPATAVATGSGQTPGVSLRIAPAAAVSTGSAPTPGVSIRIAPPAAVATGSAPTPGVTIITPGGSDGIPLLPLMGVG